MVEGDKKRTSWQVNSCSLRALFWAAANIFLSVTSNAAVTDDLEPQTKYSNRKQNAVV
jgi:hypothetical protein